MVIIIDAVELSQECIPQNPFLIRQIQITEAQSAVVDCAALVVVDELVDVILRVEGVGVISTTDFANSERDVRQVFHVASNMIMKVETKND